MSFTHTVTRAWTGSNGTTVAVTSAKTDDQEINISGTAADDATTAFDFDVDQSQVKSVYINLSKAGSVVTKSGTTVVDTFTMSANQPVIWQDGDSVANPLTGDCTSISVTLSGVGSTAALDARILIDPTV